MRETPPLVRVQQIAAAVDRARPRTFAALVEVVRDAQRRLDRLDAGCDSDDTRPRDTNE